MKSEGDAFDVRLAKPARIEQLRELMALATRRSPDGSTCDAVATGPDDAQAIAAAASASAK